MKKYFSKKLVLATTLIAIVLSFLLYSLAFSKETAKTFSADMDTPTIASLYHEKMNEFFNKKARLLIDGEGDISVPTTDEKCLKLNNNVSTFCVAIQAANFYLEFKDAMLAKWDDGSDFVEDTDEMDSQVKLFDAINVQREFIQDQVLRSKKALDMTLGGYNELRLSYALHKSYKEIIKDLLKYRDKLADLRGYVSDYPSKFVDASTPDC